MHREIIAIIVLQPITYLGKFIAIFDTGLPSVEFLTIDGEKYILHTGESIVMPKDHPHAVFGKEKFKMLLVVVF